MALNWAKLVEGKKVPNKELETERLAKEEEQKRLKSIRLAEEALLHERLTTKHSLEKAKAEAEERRKAQRLIQMEAEYMATHCKERGYLGKTWPRLTDEEILSAKLPHRLQVPRSVNQKALSWIENDALPSWWEEWTVKCHTIGALKQAFCDAFVPWVLKKEQRGYWEFETYERMLCFNPGHYSSASITERANVRQRRAELPNAVRYKSMLDWVQLREKDAKTGGDVPYGNPFWVTCKNITFENCLWAMNVLSETFRAFAKDDEIITGFLQVNGNSRLDATTITWLADFQKYVPIPHLEKDKCAQAKAKAAEKKRIEEDDDDDDWLN